VSQTEGRGLRLALIAPQTRGPSGEHVNAVIEHLPPGVEVFLVREEGFRADPRAAEGVRFAKAGSKRRSAFQVANPVRAELIARKVLRWRPDVVHLFNGEGYPWALWWVVRFGRAGVPFVLTLHDATPHIGNPVEAMTARVRGPVVRRASAIQVHAEQFVPIVRAMTSAPTEVIPHGSFAAPYLKHARRCRRR
jgi:glycosyltransferase involved in cell wall biosynthesis